MTRIPLRVTRRHRGQTNAVEFLLAVGPILYITMAFAQYYLLAQAVYMESTYQYAQLFESAYARDHTEEADTYEVNLNAKVAMLPLTRNWLGGGSSRNWTPYGQGFDGANTYNIEAGTQGDWYELWDPAIGFIGMVEQYADFPWTDLSFSDVGPPEGGDFPGVPNNGDDQDAWDDFTGDAEDAGNEAANSGADDACEESCEDLVEKRSCFTNFRNRAAACANPADWVQQTDGDGNPLFWDHDLFGRTDPKTIADGGNSDDPVYADQDQIDDCKEDDYIEMDDFGCDDMGDQEYGYSDPSEAQADVNGAQAYIDDVNSQIANLEAQLGCDC